MEPTLLGPQQIAFCVQCQHSTSYSEETLPENRPTLCPRCGDEVSFVSQLPGHTVSIEPLESSKRRLMNGDIVVIQDSQTGLLEIKRIVALPHESVQVSDGDLWVDGKLIQKSLSQFLSQAIEVDRWQAIEKIHLSDGDRRPSPHVYHSKSLWPRTGRESQTHPSPILDEYPSNASESRYLVPVRDIGLQLSLSDKMLDESIIRITLWIDGAARSVSIAISSKGICLSDFQKGKNFHRESCARWLPWSNATKPVVVMAMVDGRVLVGTDQEAHAISLSEILEEAIIARSTKEFEGHLDGNLRAEQEAVCSATTPIVFSMDEGQITIEKASILRDIHYRDCNGNDFELAATGGYHLLGDNVSNSADSRERWPHGVSLAHMIGRVIPTPGRD